MRKLQIMGLALFAMFAFGSVLVTSAFAEEALWLEDGKDITVATSADTEGLILLTNLTILGNVEIDCEGLFDGTVGPGMEDEITQILSSAGVLIGTNLTGTALNCTVENNGLCNLNELAELWGDNLPWKSLIELMAVAPPAEFLDLLFGPAGKEPGYELRCNGITNLCEGNTSTGVTSTVGGDVTMEFNEAAPISSEKSKFCESGTGDVFGTGLILLSSGKMLTVSSD
jgi:hypothetical protein